MSEPAWDHRDRRLLAGWALGVVVCVLYAAHTAGRSNEGDLRVYYDTVARIDQGLDLYQARESDEPQRVTGFIYPPPFAALFLPLTRLPFTWVRFVWCLAMGLVALRCWHTAGVLIAGTRAPPPRWRAPLAVLGALVSLRFVLSDLGHGQVNLLVIGLTLEGLVLAERRREGLAGACLALAVAIKLTPAVLIAGFGLAGRWRLVGAAAAWGLVWLAAPALVLGWGTNLDLLARFVGPVTAHNAAAHALVANNASLPGLIGRLGLGVASPGQAAQRLVWSGDPQVVRVLSLGLAALVGGATLVLARLRLAPGRAAWCAAHLALMPLVSPVSWKPHLVALILPGFLAARRLGTPGPRRLVLGAGLLLLAGSSRLFVGRALSDALLLWGGVTLALALLVAGHLLGPPDAERDVDPGAVAESEQAP
jgi:Glycosyltransferase family 87